MAHIPVLLKEIIDGLALKGGETVVDATVNRGGHSKYLAEVIGPAGYLIGIDQDSTALKEAGENLAEATSKLTLIHSNFRHIEKKVRELGLQSVDAILYDLGLSSNQLDDSGRGFTFQKDEPLEMIMNPDKSAYLFTARDIVNDWSEGHIADVLYGYGEEHFSRQIASAIIQARAKREIKTTSELVEIIKSAVPFWYSKRKINPATKTFQALRIAVNDEVEALKEGLEGGWNLLKPEGKLAVISFHSIEARIVKEFFQNKKESGEGEYKNKAVKPGADEIKANPRSRSATLRFIKKNY
jgi:16S rRNA (cytosine1402-N4)-methyltransferase